MVGFNSDKAAIIDRHEEGDSCLRPSIAGAGGWLQWDDYWRAPSGDQELSS